MADIYLDPVTDDIVVTNDIRFTAGVETVRQRIDLRMDLTKGEWFADKDAGVDYFGEILGREYDEQRTTAIFRKRLIETEGVDRVLTLTVNYTRSTRALAIYWEVAVGDEVVSGSKDL